MIGCIIQARMGSSRLPGKVMRKVDDKNPLLYYVLKQHQYCRTIDKIIVATTNLKKDDVIAKFVQKNNVECFRGSSDDVLDRYYQCSKKFSFSTIVRVTADNPLNDPTIVDMVVEKFKKGTYDFITNSIPRTFPQGISVEIFSFKALQEAWKSAKLPSEREHVTPHFYNNKHIFKFFNVTHSTNVSHLRFTVDRINDLKLVRAIIKNINKRPILMEDILNLFKERPELTLINKNYVPDEGYYKSLKEDEEFKKSQMKHD